MKESTGAVITLTRRDIIVFEQRLKNAIGSFLTFKGHSISFPRTQHSLAAVWHATEEKLLLPLADTDGTILGVFTARGVGEDATKMVTPLWPALNALIINNLLLYKQSLCDPVTGLHSRHYLLDCMEREIEAQREPLPLVVAASADVHDLSSPAEDTTEIAPAASAAPREHQAFTRSSPGILAVRMIALRDVVREFGYQFADALMLALAKAVTAHCPEQALAARTGDLEFAILLPAATAKTCRALAEQLVTALHAVSLEHPLRRKRVGSMVSVGFALYPQDMESGPATRPLAERARRLLRKARLAAALAGENMQFGGGMDGSGPVMGFGRILAEGGRVLEMLPLSRVVVSLGASMHAREGLRFSVWSGSYPRNAQQTTDAALAPLYKGEVVLMDVGENVSHAEICHVGDPSWSIEAGDRLVLVPEEQVSMSLDTLVPHAVPRDPVTGLLRHGDFFARWAQDREQCDIFSLALIRLTSQAQGPVEAEGEMYGEVFAPTQPEQLLAQAAQLCREELGRDVLGGRYGLDSLVFFHPHLTGELAAQQYAPLAAALKERLGIDVAIGIAAHPYLDFRKSDVLDNCRKALEYAILLPSPHVGVMDSLALNISADKRFSQGDTFGAIKEYQLALLADDSNDMAWNSLGVCLAGLGRHAEAERHFTRALACNPKDAMALYNLGYTCQMQNQVEAARSYYLECLTHAPDHLFSLIRLGQLSESAGDAATAREFYETAAKKPGGESVTRRHFARLCIVEKKEDEAREHLHEALIHDPQDALAMQMLARLYLDAGEDPDMAASLARQSVSLRPDLKSGWLQLARALEAMGQVAQAREARLNAG